MRQYVVVPWLILPGGRRSWGTVDSDADRVTVRRTAAHLDGVLALGEVQGLLALLLGDPLGVVLRQPAADGAGLLGAEVQGSVLLALVEEAELLALLGVDDGQDTGNGLAQVTAVEEIEPSALRFNPACPKKHSSTPRRPTIHPFPFLRATKFEGGATCAYIFCSLAPEEVTCWMRSWDSSVLSSPSCLLSSSLFFPHSWAALTLVVDCDISVSWSVLVFRSACS